MPSVTDLQQQNPEKSTPPPPTQQTTSMDLTNGDSLTQAILVLDKKQRNLGKRKVNSVKKKVFFNLIFFPSGKIGKLSGRSKKG